METRKTIRKWFWVWDFEKEERWLNEMALNGWALESVGYARYTFVRCEPGEYTVRLEMHPYDEDYVAFLREAGIEFVGRMMMWIYCRKKSADGPFDLFSDIDSRIAHLGGIEKMLAAIGLANLGIGLANSIQPNHLGWINLVCATLLMYALGRIHGKKERLELERETHE